MARTVKLLISRSLTDPEWEMLTDFCIKVRRLIGTRVVSEEKSAINGTIQYTQERGLWFEASVPPEEQIAEFLMAFRFFYLEKEPTNFHKILILLGKHAKEPESREALKHLKTQWGNALFQSRLYLSVDGHPITASHLLDLWFNAYYFHSDRKKGEELKLLNEAFSESYSKYLLLDSVYNSTKIIFIVYAGLQDLVENRRNRAP